LITQSSSIAKDERVNFKNILATHIHTFFSFNDARLIFIGTQNKTTDSGMRRRKIVNNTWQANYGIFH
jgi:hypothetical protein